MRTNTHRSDSQDTNELGVDQIHIDNITSSLPTKEPPQQELCLIVPRDRITSIGSKAVPIEVAQLINALTGF